MPRRQCDQCKGAIPDRMARQRDSHGNLVCDSCVGLNQPNWVQAKVASQNLGAPEKCAFCDSLPKIKALWYSADGLDILSTNYYCDQHSGSAMNYSSGTVEIGRIARKKHAHDSGDMGIINHCPFCLSGDTRYITRDGVKTLAETVGTIQWVLTADDNQRTSGRWVEAHIHEFGEQPLLKITVKRNQRTKVIEATPEHRWLVKSNQRHVVERIGQRSRKGLPRDYQFSDCARGHEWTDESTRWKADGSRDCKICATMTQPTGGISRAANVDVLTRDLKPGMRLSSLRQEGVGTVVPDEDGIRHGIVFGDGTATGKSANVTLWGEKDKQLLRFFPNRRYTPDNTASRVLGTGVEGVRVSGGLQAWMKALPTGEESDSYLYGWLAGYMAADGTVGEQGNVSIASAKIEHLDAVRDLAQKIGISTYGITMQMRVGFEGREPSPLYNVEFVGSTLSEEFFLIEEHRNRYLFRDYAYERFGWTVVSVEETGRTETVYCAVVPDTHSFALEDNIWTGNCGSGSVIGGSDGSVECDYCHSFFTVQVQPAHPNMPQTIDGQSTPPPGMPAGQETEMSAPVDPAVDEDETGAPTDGFGDAEADPDEAAGVHDPQADQDPSKKKNPVPPQFTKGSNLSAASKFFTADGDVLDLDRYVSRLALDHADDRLAVLKSVRERNNG